jgi:hypothetical protein
MGYDAMEIWKEIPGYEGIYEASTLGQIRTREGKVTYSVRHGKRVWAQRILRQKRVPNKGGRIDPRIILYKNKESRTFLVSRLVAMTHCAGYSDRLTVDHKDGNPLNNSANNLEWVTRANNVKRAHDAGIYGAAYKPVILDDGFSTNRFKSLSEASLFLGKGRKYLSGELARGKNQVHGYRVSRC